MPLSQYLVGPQTYADGSQPTGRAGKSGEAVIQNLHGLYYEQAVRGNIFYVASQAVVTTTVGLATTYTGLVISNPVGSQINAVLLKATMQQSVIQATQIEAYGIALGFNAVTNVTHTAAVAPQASKVGSGAVAQVKADSSATLPTAPVYAAFVTNTSSATTNAPGGMIDFDGSVILMPGAYAMFVTPAQASVAGLWFSFIWEEVAI